MSNRPICTLATCAILMTIAGHLVRADEKPLRFGDKLPHLTFKDTRYLPRSLDDFGKKKAFVLVFTTIGCPLVERYLPILQKLESAYSCWSHRRISAAQQRRPNSPTAFRPTSA